MASRPGTKIRFWILALVFVFGYGGIGYRLVELHAIKRPAMQEELQRSRYRFITENPRRGDILDSRGELIATSQTFLEVGVDLSQVLASDLPHLPRLAKILSMDLHRVEAVFEARNGRFLSESGPSPNSWSLLQRRVSEADYKAVLDLNIRGVYGVRNYERVYPKDEFAAHVIGFVRREGGAVQGLSGVEREYDYYLSGQRGWRESEVGGRRGEMAQFRRREIPSSDGLNVVLTIDSYVQHAIERELRRIMTDLKPSSATIIISEPHTGRIFGLANAPSFDPNQPGNSPPEAQKNRALTDPLEPGSTFKIVAASAALEEGLVDVGTLIDCGLDTMVMANGYVAKLPKDWKPFGVLSVAEVVAMSSNRGAAHLGRMLGERSFYDYVTKYGFGERSGIDIGIESPGILNPPNRWDGLTLSRMTMGHAIAATPMQIHYAMAAIANGGVLMKPQIVSRIVDSEGRELVEFGPVPRRRVVSRETARIVAALLQKTVSAQGTARVAEIPGYGVAGKTGTTQKLVNGRYSRQHHVGSFSGFFPSDNPQLVITVVVDEATAAASTSGSASAAPSFKRLAQELIPYYAIMPAGSVDEFAFRDQRPTLLRGN